MEFAQLGGSPNRHHRSKAANCLLAILKSRFRIPAAPSQRGNAALYIPTQQSRRTVDCFPLTRPSPNVAAWSILETGWSVNSSGCPPSCCSSAPPAGAGRSSASCDHLFWCRQPQRQFTDMFHYSQRFNRCRGKADSEIGKLDPFRCHGANLKPTLIPIPFAAWYALAWFAEMLPSAPVTRNQVELMQVDNVAS
jgi:hypothetical protein